MKSNYSDLSNKEYKLLPIDGEYQFRHIIKRGDNEYLAFVAKSLDCLYGLKKLDEDRFRIFGMMGNKNVDYEMKLIF